MQTRDDDFASSLRVPNPWAGAPVYVREKTLSTMDDARSLAAAGCASGTAVVAGFQQKGRGRAPGRTWHARPWESLLVTVAIEASGFEFPVSQLPLRAAVAVCLAIEEIEEMEVRPGIKWPNDLLVGERKLAGILCEMCGTFALVGIGVNCAQERFPSEIESSACSLRQATGRDVAPLTLLPRVLARMKETLEDGRWQEKLAARLAWRGERVLVTVPGPAGAREGTVVDVDADGCLVLHDPAGAPFSVAAGELRRA